MLLFDAKAIHGVVSLRMGRRRMFDCSQKGGKDANKSHLTLKGDGERITQGKRTLTASA